MWSSIVNNVDFPGTHTEYVSVDDVSRKLMSRYPWSLAGGGAQDLALQVTQVCQCTLADKVAGIGFAAITGEDDAFTAPATSFERRSLSDRRAFGPGDVVRDYAVRRGVDIVWPYDNDLRTLRIDASHPVWRWLWPLRRNLQLRRRFSVPVEEIDGFKWFEYREFYRHRFLTPLAISFAFVATHNNFVLDRGGKVFNRSAPVIKLPEGASEEDHLCLLGILNSSTACFWLKQVSHSKGNATASSGIPDQPWSWNWEFTGTKLQEFPVPDDAPLALAGRLDSLARELHATTPIAVVEKGAFDRETLNAAQSEWAQIRAEMISAQEELDWEVYGLYGVLGDDTNALVGKDVTKPPLQLGERAFEIALARKMAAGELETQWFVRHGSTPVTELPDHWPADYRALVERRLEKIADDPYLHLIERSECKRRWVTRSWEDMESDALRGWLQDRLEDRALWFRPEPTVRSAAQLADELRTDDDFLSVAQLYARDQDLLDVVQDLVRDQHVPGTSAWRYTDSGLRIRKAWEQTWDLQRREDAGENVGKIAVPPKYKQGDFRSVSYWRNRGKLDVPKERFTSYPEASRDGTLLLGWAGFDHLQQAQALVAYVTERQELDAWGAEQFVPLLAALAELLPWIRQWHPDVDPEFGQAPADAYDGYLDQVLLQLGLTRDDLTAWRPPAPTRGRRRKTT